MAINNNVESVQHITVGSSPMFQENLDASNPCYAILLYTIGEQNKPMKSNQEFLSLQPLLFPPKRLDHFSP